MLWNLIVTQQAKTGPLGLRLAAKLGELSSLPDGPGFEGMKESEQWRFGAVRDGSQQRVRVTVIVTSRPGNTDQGDGPPDYEDIYCSQFL